MSNKTIGEQIADLEAMRVSKMGDMDALTTKAIGEGRTKDAAEREQFDTLRDEVKAIDAELDDLRDMQKLSAEKAQPVQAAPKTPGVEAPREFASVKNTAKLEKGIGFARYVKCLGLAKGNTMQAEQIAKSLYPEMTELHSVMKAAVAAGTTTDPTWATRSGWPPRSARPSCSNTWKASRWRRWPGAGSRRSRSASCSN